MKQKILFFFFSLFFLPLSAFAEGWTFNGVLIHLNSVHIGDFPEKFRALGVDRGPEWNEKNPGVFLEGRNGKWLVSGGVLYDSLKQKPVILSLSREVFKAGGGKIRLNITGGVMLNKGVASLLVVTKKKIPRDQIQKDDVVSWRWGAAVEKIAPLAELTASVRLFKKTDLVVGVIPPFKTEDYTSPTIIHSALRFRF